jgi:aryl-phospho-beta-D-glucosidase BglC (GH1 family)
MSATQCQPVLSIKAKPPTDYHLIHHGINDDNNNNNNNNIGNSKTGAGINSNGMDYPVDEYTLGQVLRTSSSDGINTATKYMDRHWDTFLTYNDLKTLKQNGVTHLRIPMGYWIRRGSRNDDNDNDNDNEPYISGGWKYFVRACKWARQLGLVVWADLHGGT